MSVAADIRLVKRRIDDYIWQNDSEPLKSLRYFLDEHVLQFPHAAIVGGLVRDFALRGRRGFKSDVDIVIDGSAEKVSELAARLRATPNRFGGYIYQNPRWKIDFWALESTWAGKAGHVPILAMDDLLSATFFDCDAILYNLNSRSIIAKQGYLDRLKAKTIEINLMPTPSISGNALRAIRRILLWNLQPGPRLQEFLFQSLTDDLLNEISVTERKLYANCTTSNFNDVENLLNTLIDADERLKFCTSSAQQMSFQI